MAKLARRGGAPATALIPLLAASLVLGPACLPCNTPVLRVWVAEELAGSVLTITGACGAPRCWRCKPGTRAEWIASIEGKVGDKCLAILSLPDGTEQIAERELAEGPCGATAEEIYFGGQGGGGGHGGAGGGSTSSGTGGSTWPCGLDCSQIVSPVCQLAQCNEGIGQCVVVADVDGVACEDGLFCTLNESCVSGICGAGAQNDCGLTPDACENVTCDEVSQTCSVVPKQDGEPCDDVDPCTNGEICTSGLCGGGAQITQCVSNDGCCPTGCTPSSDQDCPGT